VRIVLDTNVALFALLWRGTPYRLFQTIRRQEHVRLFTSAVLLEELGSSGNYCSNFLNIIVMAGLDPAIHAFVHSDAK
jgi:predicted nucleic acid-binding protein